MKSQGAEECGGIDMVCLMLRVFAVHSHHSLNSSLYVYALDKRYEEYILHVYITREEDITLMHPLMTKT